MEFQNIQEIGIWFREIILSGADLLRDEWTPGAVSLSLVVLAVVIMVFLGIRDRQRSLALKWAIRTISTARDRSEFALKFIDIDRAFNLEDGTGMHWPATLVQRSSRKPICTAWGEYKETMVVPDDANVGVVRNNVRPGVFFNSEDLGFETGWWRIWPGLFVSIGLLLTFLGLIAALTAIGGDEITDDSLRELLNAASAKFIMSLTGLAISILLTVIGRRSTSQVEKQIQSLCGALEKRLHFQSLEAIAEEQLAAIKEQGTAIRQVATEMVAELSRPLKEDLPAAIGASIKVEVAPLIENLGQTSEQGLGQMVGDLSKRLTGDIGASMAQASGTLGEAADKLAELVGRIEGGTGRIGQEYELLAARLGSQLTDAHNAIQTEVIRGQQSMTQGTERLIQQMNDSLDAIRTNTSRGAQEISEAAADMRKAAESFKQEIDTATGNGVALVDVRMMSAAEAARGSITLAAEAVTDPLKQLAENLQAAAHASQSGADEFARLADAAFRGGEAINRGSERFDVASAAIANAAEPVRVGTEELRTASRELADGISLILESALKHSEATARQTRDSLEAASQILGHQHRGIAEAMEGLSVALAELRGYGANLDTIDQKLGDAFETYRTEVEATMSRTASQVREIVEILSPALDTLQAVVEQAENFVPQSLTQVEGQR